MFSCFYQPKGEGHFGVRHAWLNKLPPFQGQWNSFHVFILSYDLLWLFTRITSHSFVLFLKIIGTLSRPVPGCPSFKPASPQDSPQLSRSLLFSSSSRRSPSKALYYGPQLGADAGIAHRECPCCCCNEDLLKLQVINWFMEWLSSMLLLPQHGWVLSFGWQGRVLVKCSPFFAVICFPRYTLPLKGLHLAPIICFEIWVNLFLPNQDRKSVV